MPPRANRDIPSNESEPPTVVSDQSRTRATAGGAPVDGDATPTRAEPPKKRKRLTLMESLILHGRPTSDVRGRPRKSNAPGTVMGMYHHYIYMQHGTDWYA